MTEWETIWPYHNAALRIALPDAARDDVERLRKTNRLDILELRDGLRIGANSFVGNVTLGDLTVRIVPKIAAKSMPAFMRYALRLGQIEIFDDSPILLSSYGFLDLLGIVLRDEVDLLTRSGLTADYQEVEEWTSLPRGSVRFSVLARNPTRASAALPCRFQRRVTDIPLNRLALACLGSLRRSVSDHALAFDLHAREAMLSEVCIREPLTRSLLSEAVETLDRRTNYYQPVVNLAAFILAGLGIGFSGEVGAELPGFLFDMNILFERFVSRLIQEYAPQSMVIDAQDTNSSAFRMTSNPHGWQRSRLRPDIVVRNASGEPRIILDTKYKRFGAGVRPGSADIYQMTLYSVGFSREKPVPARIIYPSDVKKVGETRLSFHAFEDQRGLGDIRILALDIERCANALQQRDEAALREIVAELLSV